MLATRMASRRNLTIPNQGDGRSTEPLVFEARVIGARLPFAANCSPARRTGDAPRFPPMIAVGNIFLGSRVHPLGAGRNAFPERSKGTLFVILNWTATENNAFSHRRRAELTCRECHSWRQATIPGLRSD